MSFRPRLATGSRILLAVLMVSLLPPLAAKPGASSKLKSLTAKKRAAQLQRKQAERKLRQVKQEQAEVTGDLRESARQLATTEAGVRRTQARLRWTQNSLDQARAKLAAINTQLDQQTDMLWKRIELFYKQGSVGYVEVLLWVTMLGLQSLPYWAALACQFIAQLPEKPAPASATTQVA